MTENKPSTEEQEILVAISDTLDWLLKFKDEKIRLEVLKGVPTYINFTLGQRILEKIGDKHTTTFRLPQLKM